ncbi:MAG: thioredoxin family protein [Candidatus Micrarchaeota archaeon]
MKKVLILAFFSLMLLISGCTSVKNDKNGFYDNTSNNSQTSLESTNKTNITKSNITKLNDSTPVKIDVLGINQTNSSGLNIVNLTNNETNQNQNTTIKNKTGYLEVNYFYSPLCPFSNSINPKINELEQKYENVTNFIWYNVLIQNELDVYDKFMVKYNVTERVVPLVFVNGTYLSGMFEINSTLEELIINNTISKSR